MYKLTFLFTCLIVAIPCIADIIYVKQGGTGSGTSWADPNGLLQIAINNANYNDEVWVAAGTYYPTTEVGGTGDRYKTFQMKNGVGIYGGFPDTGDPNMTNRDPNIYETVLSGDIGVPGDNSDNCYHVFCHWFTNLNSTSILDGFTITAGNSANRTGGGMYNRDSGNPTITNCTFTGNLAERGGGMYNLESNPTITNCIFSGNSAVEYGGGMYNRDSGNPTVINCTFTGNSATAGGGMFNDVSSPTVTKCTFSDNSATLYGGGGMYNYISSSPKVTNCTFTGNSTDEASGGGIVNCDNCNPTVTNCTFSGNSAEWAGGMYNLYSNPTVTNCIFTGNTASKGGGMYNRDSSSTITGCIFTGNSTHEGGGGMYNFHSSPTATNCTFTGNSASSGGGVFNEDYSNPTVTGCILWSNTASSEGNEIYNNDPCSNPVISYCDIAGSGGSTNWDPNLGTNDGSNIDADPRFVNPGYWDSNGTLTDPNDDFWVYGDCNLQPTSPCIDTGDSTAVTVATDLDGQPRIMDGDGNDEAVIDMGAYEYPGTVYDPRVIYVNASATGGSNNGLSWEYAFISLQDALDAAIIGDEVWVTAGAYYPDPCGLEDPREASFQMKNYVGIYGGFPDTGNPVWEDRDPNQYETILSGDLLGNDNPATPIEYLLYDPCRADNCYRVFYHPAGTNLNTTTVLDGFIITAGNANGSAFEDHHFGGGMHNAYHSNPTVTGCTFIANSAKAGCSGMNNVISSPTVVNCTFTYSSGSGMNNNRSDPTVTNCTFSNNSDDFRGGGMYNYLSDPTVTNCIFIGNLAGIEGGGMYNYYYSSPTVTGCTFAGNSADEGGGGMNNKYYSDPTVTSCTFIGNSAEYGGGMYNEDYSNPPVTGCILWGNTASSGGNEIYNDVSIPLISYCDIAGSGGSGSWDPNLGTDDGGNIDADPLFADPNGSDNIIGTEDDNLRLLPGSPCVDAGDNSAIPADNLDLDSNGNTTEPIPFDIDGLPRFYDDPHMIDTGVGPFPIVDMGAHEFIPCDFEPDGDIDVFDFITFIMYWLDTGCGRCGGADLTGEGDVDLADFAEFVVLWQAGI